MLKIITILSVTLLSACSGMSAVERAVVSSNKSLVEKKWPERAVYKDLGSGASVYTFEWAGTPGTSIVESAEPILKTDILNSLEINCGYSPTNLLETRIVEHKNPEFYEVWVFKDKASKRPDKTSAMSVLITFLSNGRGTDLRFIGKCHS